MLPAKNFFLLLLSTALVSCSLFPEPTTKITRFSLTPIEYNGYKGLPVGQVFIDQPQLDSILQTQRIILKPSPIVIESIANIEWADRLDILIKETFAHSLENTNLFKTVHQNESELGTEYYLLKIKIPHFEFKQSDELNIVYNITVYKMPEKELVFRTSANIDKRSSWKNPEDFMKAFDEANQDCLRRLFNMFLTQRKQKQF